MVPEEEVHEIYLQTDRVRQIERQKDTFMAIVAPLAGEGRSSNKHHP